MRSLIILLVLPFTLSLSAQQGFHLGVKGTPQAYSFINPDDTADPAFAFGFGASLGYFFLPRFGVVAEVIGSGSYEQRVALNTPSSFEFVGTSRWLHIPVMLCFDASDQQDVSMILRVGVQFTRLLEATTSYQSSTGVVYRGFGPEEFYNDRNVGLVLELGPAFSVAQHLSITAVLHGDYWMNGVESGTADLFADRPATHFASLGVDVGLEWVFGAR